MRKFFGKPIDIFPMDCATPPIKKTGSGHHIGAGTNRTNDRAIAIKAADQIQN